MSKKLKGTGRGSDVESSVKGNTPGDDASTALSDAGGIADVFDALEEIWEEEDEQERLTSAEAEDDAFDDLDGIDEDELKDFLAGLPGGDVDFDGEPLGDWGLVTWGIEVARNDNGLLKKAKEARDDPASLVLYDGNGSVIASVLLTPPVHAQMLTALEKVGKLYEDPVKPKVEAKDRWENIVQWHLNHKFLGSVSVLFTLAFLVFMVIGFVTTI